MIKYTCQCIIFFEFISYTLCYHLSSRAFCDEIDTRCCMFSYFDWYVMMFYNDVDSCPVTVLTLAEQVNCVPVGIRAALSRRNKKGRKLYGLRF